MKGLAAHLLIFLIAAFAVAGAETRPNIIFIVADDLRWDTLGYAGNPIVKTPHIDELARTGVRFRNHFVTSSICNVSRATMFRSVRHRPTRWWS